MTLSYCTPDLNSSTSYPFPIPHCCTKRKSSWAGLLSHYLDWKQMIYTCSTSGCTRTDKWLAEPPTYNVIWQTGGSASIHRAMKSEYWCVFHLSFNVQSRLWYISQSWRSISRDFSLTDHTLPTCPEPARQKMAQSPLKDTTQPVDSKEEGWSPTTDRRWLIKKWFK